MKRSIYLTLGIAAALSGVVSFILMFIASEHTFLLAISTTCLLSLIFVVSDPDNQAGKTSKIIALLSGISILIMMIACLSSCSSSKYGCGHGANPRMTWNRMVERINRP
jgi:hypothetical protein